MLSEFNVSRKALDRYRFEENLFPLSGKVVFANFHAARMFAHKMNEKRDPVNFPEQAVKAGHINAMGMINEILRYVVDLFCKQKNTQVLKQAMDWLYERLGTETVDKTLQKFADDFPPAAIYKGEFDSDTYLKGETADIPNSHIAVEEMLMLWLSNMNPALASFIELFDDTSLKRETSYQKIIDNLHEFFDTQPVFGPDNRNLMDMLLSPAVAIPHSLTGQLEYILKRWGYLLGRYLYRLLSSLDLIKEEEKMAIHHIPGPGPSRIYEFTGLDLEIERFSPDSDWMPNLVMIAKNIYVWLDQLSKKYERSINRLDQIPDEELNIMARWGFSGLWLIGLWERSRASQKIKQLCGNPEASASAYSIFDYRIAADLGGEGAYQDLKDRALKRGIRLASDMVPNHVGIDSKWVIEYPDRFVSKDHSPFPSYNFSGPDLSCDKRVGVYIDDHYYTRSDAAVVFKRVDRRTGSEKYIYHGNDGTHMPWNDTAQLNYLDPEVREEVIQSILDVARKFPIIRFDAAMTLTKKHYQRLWFPEPGTGGAIPSRTEHGMTKCRFDTLIPEEFWREVVDRIADEVPDTLLLAEAFWLMEGYFVRTLGMHRVYNSAFMNMLKNEENAKYRTVLKNTLKFDPEILKRFVNFMNNPDEETAAAQFGKDDKYFGVCMMMVTMPGLPMFGHGQVEGFEEKYGMEYRRAYLDEQPDTYMIQRHEKEIFPLLCRRYLFAGVENFLLYDFFTPEGHVNEDVFAYSNRIGDSKALMLYHNKFSTVRGWIRSSAAYSAKAGEGGGERVLINKKLGEGIGLHDDKDYFCIFRDHVTGLEYIRNSKELSQKGLYIELGAYKYHVFLDFLEARDNAWHQYAHLAAYLDGRGVPDIEEILGEILLRPIHCPFKELVNAGTFQRFMDIRVTTPQTLTSLPVGEGKDGVKQLDMEILDEVEQKINHLLREAKQFCNGAGNEKALTKRLRQELEIILQLPVMEDILPLSKSRKYKAAIRYLKADLTDDLSIWGSLLGWLFIHSLGKLISKTEFEQWSRSWIDEWLLGRIIAAVLQDLGLDNSSAWKAVMVGKLFTSHQRWFEVEVSGKNPAHQVLENLLKDAEVQQFLRVNRYQEVLWFNKEAFDQLLWWMMLIAVINIKSDPFKTTNEVIEEITKCYDIIWKIQKAKEKSGYQIGKLLEILSGN